MDEMVDNIGSTPLPAEDRLREAIVTGRLQQRSFEQNGEKKSAVEVVANDIGPSLKWATAQVTRAERQPTLVGSERV